MCLSEPEVNPLESGRGFGSRRFQSKLSTRCQLQRTRSPNWEGRLLSEPSALRSQRPSRPANRRAAENDSILRAIYFCM
jgi:hypothetical protein